MIIIMIVMIILNYRGTLSWYIFMVYSGENIPWTFIPCPPNRTPSSCSRRPLSKTPRTWERGTRNGNLFQCAIENIESLPFWKDTVNHTYSHLVMTNIAMENPNHQWRFRSLGKSSADGSWSIMVHSYVELSTAMMPMRWFPAANPTQDRHVVYTEQKDTMVV